MFRDNRKLPIHRWYPFIEGYSAQLVGEALSECRDASSVFDPFGGSGTTALTAAFLGISSSFTEANPYMAWLSRVKVNASREASAGKVDFAALQKIARDPLRTALLAPVETHPLLEIDERRNYFPPGIAMQIVTLLAAIDQQTSGATQALARLAVATSITPSSNMIRRTDLRRRRASDRGPTDFAAAVSENLQMIMLDVQQYGPQVGAEVVQLGDDAKGSYTADHPFTTVITSPPYLNGTNYGRNTKLEMFALGFLSDEQALEGLRLREVTAGINNVSNRIPVVTEFEGVERIAARVAAVTYDQRIPKMIRAYFSDMSKVFRQVEINSASGAEMWVDIGDSRYAGITVPTHALLADVAVSSGWEFNGAKVLRQRRSYDGTVLSQTLLRFQKGV